MREQIIQMQQQMKEAGIDCYIVPTTDPHGSEYISDHYKCREYLSGFTGSAGTLLVEQNAARLWTDGRYFLQAGKQLAGTGITLMKTGEPGVPTLLEYLKSLREAGPFTLGFDGRLISKQEGKDYESLDVPLVSDQDLMDKVWTSRPEVKALRAFALAISVTGRTTGEKLSQVRDLMKDRQADHLLLAALDEIAWLFNLRGRDVAHTPVFFGFALVSRDRVQLFTYDNVLPEGFGLAESFGYDEIIPELSKLPAGCSVWMDGNQANYALFQSLGKEVRVIDEMTPVQKLKAVKNASEIASTRSAHVKDGVAMVEFLYWLKKEMQSGAALTEISAADYLEACRFRQEGCYDLSFDTIAGYGPSGAIIHYAPTEETNAQLKPEGFLLVDSGGQYEGGTTDITRTIALGPLTDKMKEYYTAVLRSHIALATCVFDESQDCRTLDTLARGPVRALGLDYNHGTGHGVGHLLSVHEGPQRISPKGSGPVLPGMITSNEPGVYIEGEFGIRLENEILCYAREDGRYAFETITFCPFEPDAILPEKMTEAELSWLRDYHRKVYEILAPELSPEVRQWLREETGKI